MAWSSSRFLGWNWVKNSFGNQAKEKQRDKKKRRSTVWLELEQLEKRVLMINGPPPVVLSAEHYQGNENAGTVTITAKLEFGVAQTKDATVGWATEELCGCGGSASLDMLRPLTDPTVTSTLVPLPEMIATFPP